MTLQPQSYLELASALASATASKRRVEKIDLSGLSKLIEHNPADMTATVEAGMSFDQFQILLATKGQFLALNPPRAGTSLTIADVIDGDLNGSWRYGYGTIRDYLIGIKLVLPDGRLMKAGGKVVKNVAGYDLPKVFIGARRTLGIVVEATFKLRPIPEFAKTFQARFTSLDHLNQSRRAVLASPLEPVAFDAYNQPGYTLILEFRGSKDELDYQSGIADRLGFESTSDTEYLKFVEEADITKASVLPSQAISYIKSQNIQRFVAHIGNGIIYYKGESRMDIGITSNLMRRLKVTYDPGLVLPVIQ